MIIIKGLRVENYKCVKHATMDNLGDLNIFIGPNNCGKTSLLNAICKLSNLTIGGEIAYSCPKCDKVRGEIIGFLSNLGNRERYLDRQKVKITFLLNEEEVDRQVPQVLASQKKLLSTSDADYKDELILTDVGTNLIGEHLSIFAHRDILGWLSRTFLVLPEQRLQTYKGTNIRDYVATRNLGGRELRMWLDYLTELVDRKIVDYTYGLNLRRETDNQSFESSFEEEGSGLRSLVCPIADILSARDARILAIDEPELGLNPSSKQEFMRFLLKETSQRQIFVATHDPTFVNPVLWKGYNVSVYLYSLLKREFVRVNLKENREDPETFGGYLPHTISLKDVHIYVEGSSDVYIFEVFLRKYLKQVRNWAEILQRIGIYHLGGDFWPHLLYTIPECPPYKCVVVFDGDKRDEKMKICEEWNKTVGETFKFCRELGELQKVLGTQKPIYCLKKRKIEDYFDKDKLPTPYNKKIDGPRIAEEMKDVPSEFANLFKIVLEQGVTVHHVAFSDKGKGND